MTVQWHHDGSCELIYPKTGKRYFLPLTPLRVNASSLENWIAFHKNKNDISSGVFTPWKLSILQRNIIHWHSNCFNDIVTFYDRQNRFIAVCLAPNAKTAARSFATITIYRCLRQSWVITVHDSLRRKLTLVVHARTMDDDNIARRNIYSRVQRVNRLSNAVLLFYLYEWISRCGRIFVIRANTRG